MSQTKHEQFTNLGDPGNIILFLKVLFVTNTWTKCNNNTAIPVKSYINGFINTMRADCEIGSIYFFIK